MNKALLASTALVGAALLSAPAYAGTVGTGNNMAVGRRGSTMAVETVTSVVMTSIFLRPKYGSKLLTKLTMASPMVLE